MDRIQLGLKIRKIRKAQKMTLRELASGICSLGKMSNIENGRSDVSEKELQLICEKLSITKNDLFPIQEQKLLNDIILEFRAIEDSIFLGQYEHAVGLLHTLKKNNPTGIIHLWYLEALLLYKQTNYQKALSFLSNICKHIPINESELFLKSKAYNLKGVIYYQLENSNTSIEMFLKAQKTVNCKINRDKIFFNISIIHASKGNTPDARITLTQITNPFVNNDLRYIYLIHVLNIIDADYIDSLEKIINLRSSFFERRDYDTFIRSLLLYIYLYEKQSFLFQNAVEQIEEIVIAGEGELLPKLNGSGIVYTQLVQSLIKIRIQEKNEMKINKLFPIAEKLVSMYPNHPIHSLTYYLMVKHQQNQPNPDSSMQREWIKTAILLVPEEYSTYKGILYYELARLNEPISSSQYRLAAEHLYTSILHNYNNVEFKDILPDFYIY